MKAENTNLIPAEILLLMQQCEASGKSRSSWCKEQGVSYHKFNYWLKKQRSASDAADKETAFVSVKVESIPLSGQIEIIYSDNVRVLLPSGIQMSVIKSLLPAFSNHD